MRVNITRGEFARLWGYEPLPEFVGVMMLNAERTEIIVEYVFTDQPHPEVAELERLWKL